MRRRQRFRGSLAALVPALCGLALLAPAPAAADDPALQSPFGGELPPKLVEPESQTRPPPGFEVSAEDAIGVADATGVVQAELAESPGAEPRALIRGDRWQVEYVDGDARVAEVIVDGSSGQVIEAWRDFQVGSPLARGYDGAIAQAVNSPWVWITLSLLFCAPFFDPRRPLRLLHLDLLVLIGLGVSLFFFNRAEVTASVALTYPVLGYFLIRMLVAGFWPRERSGPLIPWAPVRWLALGIAVLAVARITLNLVDSRVIDIGVAGVVGADRIADGEPLYEGAFSLGLDLKGDVYGPVNYLSYLPFELVWPWDGVWDAGVGAAHAAAICFDLACAIGLIALGRRLRAGDEGRALGLALGFAWLACPWTLYAMNANANDALIAALGVGALLALRSPPARGALIALAAAAKFGPAALAPLFATADSERRWRGALLFAIAFVVVVVVVTVPFIPDGGLRELYDRTLGYQATRGSPFSVWGQAPSLDSVQPLVRALAVLLAVGVAFVPRTKDALQVAALAAAVTIAVQLTASHWFYFYVVWFLPFVLVAVFASQERIRPDASSAARAAPS
ncbi:MAG TPA: glycosyltransferase 87 family protein [Solirubrobacterales bacterium]|nr:glycosyltransferase 87 family protein [Solirubrobacterales bacterium]